MSFLFPPRSAACVTYQIWGDLGFYSNLFFFFRLHFLEFLHPGLKDVCSRRCVPREWRRKAPAILPVSPEQDTIGHIPDNPKCKLGRVEPNTSSQSLAARRQWEKWAGAVPLLIVSIWKPCPYGYFISSCEIHAASYKQ